MGRRKPKTNLVPIYNIISCIIWRCMIVGYDDMNQWAKTFDLLKNRLGVCNQILGCRYHHSPENPVRLSCVSGVYVVTFLGDEVVRFRVWDLPGLKDAYDMLDHWQDCLWCLSRSGRLVVA